jgi:hypothetical protein
VLPVSALADISLQNRCRRLLDLQEQWVLRVATLEQDDERASPNAPHADYLAGRIDNLETLKQVAPIVLQRRPVRAELLMDCMLGLIGG